jgi:hypothetical protein
MRRIFRLLSCLLRTSPAIPSRTISPTRSPTISPPTSRISRTVSLSRNTAFTYKGKAVDVKEIARDPGVRYALEGSVRRPGDKVTINAQLISTETGAHVWAASRASGGSRPVAG